MNFLLHKLSSLLNWFTGYLSTIMQELERALTALSSAFIKLYVCILFYQLVANDAVGKVLQFIENIN